MHPISIHKHRRSINCVVVALSRSRLLLLQTGLQLKPNVTCVTCIHLLLYHDSVRAR